MPPTRLAETDRLQAALGERYEVEREVARGGWSSVYRARDRKHDRVVAVKVFHPELAHTLGPERFLQEIRLVASFQHPYILPLHDSGETAESLYYVMPFVEGETLRDRLNREGRLPLDQALEIARDVLSALDYAHARGVVHRDIKPENVLLSGGHALVADFGIARAVSAARGERLSRPGIAVGTPAYMAPEQALFGEEVDGRSDLYGVGCVLYEMLAGRPPYADVTLQDVIDRHAEDAQPVDLATLREDIPAPVAAAVMRALALRVDDRFPSARAFADAITPPATPVNPTWPPAVAAARARRERRRRAGLVTLAGIAVAGVALAASWRWLAPRLGIGVSPTAVAVFPFSVRAGPEHAYLSSGMVDLLSADLDGAGHIRSVDPHAVVGTAHADSIALTPGRAEQLAARLGAGRYVLGTIVEDGGRLRLHAALYERGGGGRPIAQAQAEGVDGKLFDLVDELAAELLAGERGGPANRLTRLAAVTTQSLPALKLYLRGEEQLREGHADSAMVTFGAALQMDPRFGLAAYRRAVAADWAANFRVAREAGEQALRLSDRLMDDDRQLLQAFLAWHHGDAAKAEALYRAVLAEQPDNVEAWYQLGEVLFHYGAMRGHSFVVSRDAFEHARALDPKNVSVVFHLLDIAARQGRWSEFDQLLRDAEPQAEGVILMRRRALRAFAIGDRVEQQRALDALAAGTDGSIIVAAGAIGAFQHDLEGSTEVARLLVVPTRPAATRAYGYVTLAQLAWARGRPTEAARYLDAAGSIDSVAALEMRAYGASIRWLPAPLRQVEQVRARLLAWDGTAQPRSETVLPTMSVHDSIHPIIRAYLAAMLSARLGDRASAQRYADTLTTLRAPAMEQSLPADLTRSVQASLALAHGDDAAALTSLEGIRAAAPMDRIANSPYFGYAHERFLRAELLRTLGRPREAIGWYESLGEGRHDILFLGPAQLRLGIIYESLGDRARAAEAYRTVVRLWRDCEPPFKPHRDYAAARLAHLAR